MSEPKDFRIGDLLVKKQGYFVDFEDPRSLLLISDPMRINSLNPSLIGDWRAVRAMTSEGRIKIYPMTLLKELYELA